MREGGMTLAFHEASVSLASDFMDARATGAEARIDGRGAGNPVALCVCGREMRRVFLKQIALPVGWHPMRGHFDGMV